MGYAVLSDVHSNLEALNAVIEDLKSRGIRDVYFLGDAVGYGPDPDECVEILKAECTVMLAGNHDMAAAGLADLSRFNMNARAAIEWTRQVMQGENIELLSRLPVKADIREQHIMIVHSTPCEPEEWHYILRIQDAGINFKCFDARVCFIGHSHSPVIIEQFPSGEMITHKEAIQLNPENRYIINAGSVGQPRDGNPKAGYVLVENTYLEIVRVPYDVRLTQDKMTKEGLPLPLIERIAYGI